MNIFQLMVKAGMALSLKLRLLAIMISLALVLITVYLPAQQQSFPPSLSVEKIKDNIYMIKGGSGANCYLIVGKKSNLLFDAKMTADSLKEMLLEIKKVSPLPLSMIILTHSDGDHVNGLKGLTPGIKILAHKKTYEEMLTAAEQMPELKDYLPTETYEQSKILDFEGTRLELKNFGPAHTSGDTLTFI
ncbi:MAG: MBL fold metallo-hydrolase, partial [Candidatus Saccharicenans sp.]